MPSAAPTQNSGLRVEASGRRRATGGQRQCVAIARTATFASKMIIMDEPTAALGVQETAQVENIIRTLKENG